MICNSRWFGYTYIYIHTFGATAVTHFDWSSQLFEIFQQRESFTFLPGPSTSSPAAVVRTATKLGVKNHLLPTKPPETAQNLLWGGWKNQEFGHKAVPPIPWYLLKEHQAAINQISSQCNTNRTHCTQPAGEGVGNRPQKQQIPAQSGFQGSSQGAADASPTHIFKYTEFFDLEPHPPWYARHKDPSIQCIWGMRDGGFVSSSCENPFIEYWIYQSDGTGVWCWWQNIKQRFHPKSFGINVILNTSFSEARISA